jgi:hypothetical protein
MGTLIHTVMFAARFTSTCCCCWYSTAQQSTAQHSRVPCFVFFCFALCVWLVGWLFVWGVSGAKCVCVCVCVCLGGRGGGVEGCGDDDVDLTFALVHAAKPYFI